MNKKKDSLHLIYSTDDGYSLSFYQCSPSMHFRADRYKQVTDSVYFMIGYKESMTSWDCEAPQHPILYCAKNNVMKEFYDGKLADVLMRTDGQKVIVMEFDIESNHAVDRVFLYYNTDLELLGAYSTLQHHYIPADSSKKEGDLINLCQKELDKLDSYLEDLEEAENQKMEAILSRQLHIKKPAKRS